MEQRSALDVEIDREWMIGASSEDPAVAELHFRRSNDLRQQRAMKAPSGGGLAAEGASLASSDGNGMPAQLEGVYQLNR